jgi:hypothetical protein
LAVGQYVSTNQILKGGTFFKKTLTKPVVLPTEVPDYKGQIAQLVDGNSIEIS